MKDRRKCGARNDTCMSSGLNITQRQSRPSVTTHSDLVPERMLNPTEIKTEDIQFAWNEEQGKAADIKIEVFDEYGEQSEEIAKVEDLDEEELKIEIKEEHLCWREGNEAKRLKTNETSAKEMQLNGEEFTPAPAPPVISQMFVLTESGLEPVENFLDDNTRQQTQQQESARIISVQMESSENGPSTNGDLLRDESITICNTRLDAPQPDSSTISQNPRKGKFKTYGETNDFAAERLKQIRIRQETQLRYLKECHEHHMAMMKLEKEIEELERKYWERKSQE